MFHHLPVFLIHITKRVDRISVVTHNLKTVEDQNLPDKNGVYPVAIKKIKNGKTVFELSNKVEYRVYRGRGYIVDKKKKSWKFSESDKFCFILDPHNYLKIISFLKELLNENMFEERPIQRKRCKGKGKGKRRTKHKNNKKFKKQHVKLVYGECQMGKSNFILNLIVQLKHRIGMNVILVFRNLTSDKDGFISKKNAMFRDSKFDIDFIDIISEEAIQKQKGKPRVMCVIANANKLNKLYDIVNRDNELNWNTALIVDEADFLIKPEDNATSATSRVLNKFKSLVRVYIPVTATPTDVFLDKKKLKIYNDVWIIEKPNYKGFKQCTIEKYIPETSKLCTSKKDDIREKCPGIEDYMKGMINRDPDYCEKFKEYHPNIVLFRLSIVHDPYKRFFAYISQNKMYKHTVFFYYNGENTILYIDTKEPLCFKDKSGKIVKKTIPNQKIHLDNGEELPGVFHLCKDLRPGQLLEYLYENGGIEKYPTIFLFAGNLAGRSISYGADNYKWCLDNNRLHWSCKHYFVLISDTMDEAEAIQVSSRIYGVDPSSLKRYLYCTEKIAVVLFKSNTRNKEFIHRSIVNDITVGESLHSPMLKDKFTDRSPTKSHEYKPNQVVNPQQEEEYGGYPISSYEITSHIDVKESKEEERGAEESKEDYGGKRNGEWRVPIRDKLKRSKQSLQYLEDIENSIREKRNGLEIGVKYTKVDMLKKVDFRNYVKKNGEIVNVTAKSVEHTSFYWHTVGISHHKVKKYTAAKIDSSGNIVSTGLMFKQEINESGRLTWYAMYLE